MAGRKFEPTNINGLKFFKGTLYGPAEDLPEAKRRFRLMNQEEMDRYDRKVDESKGFDVDGCTGAMPGRIVPISPKSGEWQVAESLARWAVDKQLRRGGNPLESISVVKVNLQPVRGGMFYITLTAFDTADGETKTYRAKVWHGIWEYKLMYFEEFPEKTGTSYKARASKSRSKISKAKKGKAVQSSGGVLLGFNALLRKIKSQNPSMTHTMARKAASKNWKLLSNAGKCLESISVVKANNQPVEGGMYYITLTAFDTADGETKTYRAKVWLKPGKKYHLEYFKEFKPPEKAGTSYKARASKS